MDKPKRYTYPSYKGTISVSEFRKLPKDAKIDVMRTWFYERYEDPVHNSPWVDGEYLYIHGGPYYAKEELEGEFFNLVAQETIEELAGELESDCMDWTHAQNSLNYEDYDDDYEWYRAVSSKDAFNAFTESIGATRELLKSSQSTDQHYLRLLYVSAITSLETYLSDFFINIVKSERGYLQIFIEKFEKFEKEKFPLSQIFSKMSEVEKVALEELRKLMWHDLAKVSSIYKSTLDIKFPEIPELYKAVLARHDYVHRSGKKPDGEKRHLEVVQVENVLNQSVALVSDIQSQWQKQFESRHSLSSRLLSDQSDEEL